MRYNLLLIVLLCSSLLCATNISAHGEETHQEEDDSISLSLEVILLITIFSGFLLLIVLSDVIGINDRSLLIKIAVITLVLLLLDYTYVKYYK